jgi:hypothetical protein
VLILDGSRGLSVPEGVMEVTILVDEIVVDVEDSTFELLEVTTVDSVLETEEDVFMLVDEDVELIANDEDVERSVDDEDVDEDDTTVP